MYSVTVTCGPNSSATIQDTIPTEGRYSVTLAPNEVRVLTLTDSQFDHIEPVLDDLVSAGLITYIALNGFTSRVANDSIVAGTTLNDVIANIIAGVAGALLYKGTWDANTNTPTITSGVGTLGHFYVVSVAGNTTIDGESDWNVGDWIVFNGIVWQKADHTDVVSSVAGKTGAVILVHTDITDFDTGVSESPDVVANSKVRAANEAAGERHGFPNRTDSLISRTDSTPDRTFKIEPSGVDFDVYVLNEKYTFNTEQTVQWTDVEGLHYFYFNDSGVLQTTPTFSTDLITKYAIVAIIYWDATNNVSLLLDERHGLTMSGLTHLYLHQTKGAAWDSGLAVALSAPADSDGSSNTHVQFGVSNGIFWDEDVKHIITDGAPQDISPTAQIPILYRLGASGDWRKVAADAFPLLYTGKPSGYVGALVPYNQYTGGVWQLTSVTNNYYMLMHYVAVNNIEEPIMAIVGQNEYNNIIAARAGAEIELQNLLISGLPSPEMLPIATVIFQTSSGYTNTPKARIRSTAGGYDYIDWRTKGAISSSSTVTISTLFGSDYQREESLGESSTTLNTFQDKVTLTTPSGLIGTYRIGWKAMMNNADKAGEVQLYNVTDAVVVGSMQPIRVKDTADNYPPRGAFHHIEMTGTAKTFKIQWRDVAGGQTQYIKDAAIEFWRVA